MTLEGGADDGEVLRCEEVGVFEILGGNSVSMAECSSDVADVHSLL